MKVLFINPPYTNFEGMKNSAGHTIPLNLAYLSSYLKSKLNCEVKMLDCEADGLGYKEIEERIRDYEPEIIGITTLTPPMKHVLKITGISKKINPNCKVVLGGVHPTALPEQTLKETGAHFIVLGEGEETFYELVKGLVENTLSPEKIDGLCFKNDAGKVIKNKEREFVKNLDDLPFPDRDLFDLAKYYSAPTKRVSDEKIATPILTSRGCAFRCVHCVSEVLWHRTIRFRSVENVISEIEECVNKYGIREFNILDDTFTLNKGRVLEFCKSVADKNLRIYWICFSRVNTIDQEMVESMKKAGCKKISFGLETGSQKVLDLMNKDTTLEMGRHAVSIVRKSEMQVHASFMFGNLGETKDTIKETIKFAKSLDLDNATFFITAPVPGTYLFKVAMKNGQINETTKWEEFAPLTNTKPVLVQNNLTAEELIHFQKRAFREFYLRPKYIWHKIKQMKSKEGIKNIFAGLKILSRILVKPKKQ